MGFNDAISFTDDFIQECIKSTLPEKEKYWYGINFEKQLSVLTEFAKKTEG